jgi:hypothetical protein
MSYDIISTILYEKFVKMEGFMKKKDNIVNLILSVGFSMKSKINMKECIDDENQFIYVFEVALNYFCLHDASILSKF